MCAGGGLQRELMSPNAGVLENDLFPMISGGTRAAVCGRGEPAGGDASTRRGRDPPRVQRQGQGPHGFCGEGPHGPRGLTSARLTAAENSTEVCNFRMEASRRHHPGGRAANLVRGEPVRIHRLEHLGPGRPARRRLPPAGVMRFLDLYPD